MQAKSLIRSQCLAYRKLLSQQEYLKRNEQICQNLLSKIIQYKIKILHVFMPIAENREPDLRTIFPSLWKEGITTLTSQTLVKEKKLIPIVFDYHTVFVNNKWKIPEPISDEKILIERIDCVVVPLVAFDRQGHRIGYGGGYYDQFLLTYNGLTLGVSLAPPFDQIPQNNWDVRLDEVISYCPL